MSLGINPHRVVLRAQGVGMLVSCYTEPKEGNPWETTDGLPTKVPFVWRRKVSSCNSLYVSTKLPRQVHAFFTAISVKMISWLSNSRKTQAGIFICDLDVFTFAVDSKNAITPLGSCLDTKVP